MRHLLIVDDEEIIRTGMSTLLDWEEMGYTIHLAENGKQAMQRLQEYPIETILTDIWMPGMDGIELAKRIHACRENCVVILLSGYNEFTYAQEAIQIGVFRYLTKPIQKDVLVKTLREARDYLANKAFETERLRRLEDFLEQNKPILIERFLLSLVRGDIQKAQLWARAEELGIALCGRCLLCAVLSASYAEKLDVRGKNALDLAIESVFRDFFHPRGITLYFFESADRRKGILFSFLKEKADTPRMIAEVLEEVNQHVRVYLNAVLTIGVSLTAQSPEDIPELYQQACRAISYAPSVGKGTVLYIQDFQEDSQAEQIFRLYTGKIKALLDAIRRTSLESCDAIITEICEELARYPSLTTEQLRLIGIDFEISLHKTAMEYGLSPKDIFGTDCLSLEKMELNRIPVLREMVMTKCGLLIQAVEQRYKTKNKDFVNKAKRYMKEHYQRADLNLPLIAGAVFVSPAYLSQCFKSSEGISCVEYLTLIRLDESKRMLRETSLKIYQIAENVGYSDSQYFSTLFKKIVGVPPSEYRKFSI